MGVASNASQSALWRRRARGTRAGDVLPNLNGVHHFARIAATGDCRLERAVVLNLPTDHLPTDSCRHSARMWYAQRGSMYSRLELPVLQTVFGRGLNCG
jgi:hypothetical protein